MTAGHAATGAGQRLLQRLSALHGTLTDDEQALLGRLIDSAVDDVPFDIGVITEPLEGPFPGYRWLQEHDPVHWDRDGDAWLVTRYEDVVAVEMRCPVSHQAKFDKVFAGFDPGQLGQIETFLRINRTYLGHLDGAAHARMRALFEAVVSKRRVAALRPAITQHVRALLEPHRPEGQLDLVADVSHRLALEVGAELLGLDDPDAIAGLGEACERMMLPFSPDQAGEIAHVESAITVLVDYFRERLLQPAPHVADRVLADLAAEVDRGIYTMDELAGMCIEILAGGFKAIGDVLGVLTLTLLLHPEQLARLVADPTLVPAAVEELLRYDGLALSLSRDAIADFELSGTAIRAGERVMVLPLAANRDPDRFGEPDTLDLARRPTHLAFGKGRHYCPGAALARLVLGVALTELVALPGLRLAGDEHLHDEGYARRKGLHSLKLAFDPAP